MRLSVYGHSKQLYLYSYCEMWDRLSFYGTRAMLILYLTRVFSYNDYRAYAFFGAYIALGFFFPLLGGIVSDRILGQRMTLYAGLLIAAAGNLVLSIPTFPVFLSGLGLMLFGSGLIKPNVTNSVGDLYKKDSEHRTAGFTFFYMGMNLGAVLGPLAYGFVGLKFGMHYAFLIGFIGLSSSWFVQYKFSCSKPPSGERKGHASFWLLTIIVLGLLVPSVFFFGGPILADRLFAAIITGTLLLLVLHFIAKSYGLRLILYIAIICFFAVLYFSASQQVSSSITLFISRQLNTGFLSINIPPEAFSSIKPLFIILLTPMVAILWCKLASMKKEPSVLAKISLGIGFAGLGFIVLSLSAHSVEILQNNRHGMEFLLLGYLFLGIGEIFIVPVALSAIHRLSPTRIKGTIMGTWFMSSALAGYVGSRVAELNFIQKSSVNTSLLYYKGFANISYMLFAIMLFGIFVSILVKKLKWDREESK